MRQIGVIIILFFALILTSGCLGEKTVIKANIKITENNGTPIIEVIDITSASVSKAVDYTEAKTHYPGIYMSTIWDSVHIDYWRSVEYKGSGEYEIISELKSIPNKGDRVDVHFRIYDINNTQIAESLVIMPWE